MTDVAITEVLQRIAPTSIIWKPKVFLPFHPNAMKFISFSDHDQQSDEWTVYSIGGGALSEGKGDDDFFKPKQVYEMNTLSQILDWCEKTVVITGNTLSYVRESRSGTSWMRCG